MLPHSSSFLRSPFRPLLLLLPALLLSTTLAIPLRLPHKVPDLWAQLLHANRFSLVPSPQWTTTDSNTHHLQTKPPSSNYSASFSSLHLNPVSRTKVFNGKGNKSKFRCNLHDPPSALNIDRVIKKVITICESSWVSEQLVNMKITFSDLGEPSTLANGGGTFFVKMRDSFDTILPVAAAEAVRNRDLNAAQKNDGKYDVLVTINSKTPWYDGIDAQCPPDKYDLITVILHEVYHNLVFAGSIDAVRLDSARQSASLYKNYRTRFDSFIMTSGNCAVLSYLSNQQLVSQAQRNSNELMADALCSGQLYWGHGNDRIAKLHSPPIFRRRSSVYHLDPSASNPRPGDSLMYPTVQRGKAQHTVGQTILKMQSIILDPKISGANFRCSALPIPVTPSQPAYSQNFSEIHQESVVALASVIAEGNRVAGLPIWALVLIIILAILLALLLIGLCIAIAIRRKGGRSNRSFSSIFDSFRGRGTSRSGTSRSSSSNRRTIWGGHTSSSSSRSGPAFSWMNGVKSTRSSSKKPSKHGTSTEKKVSSRHSQVTLPPPIASVHTYEKEESVPVKRKCHKHKCRKHCTCVHKKTTTTFKTCAKSSSHKRHSCEKVIKKTVCCKCYCCKYEPKTCRTSTRCCKSSSSSSSLKKCTTSTPSSSCPKSFCKSSSCRSSACKPSTCKPSTCKPSTCKSSSCKRLPPSTKPPTTKPPSTKPVVCPRPAVCPKPVCPKPVCPKPACPKPACPKPTTKATRTCKKSCKSCKPSGKRCACRSCHNIVEINIC